MDFTNTAVNLAKAAHQLYVLLGDVKKVDNTVDTLRSEVSSLCGVLKTLEQSSTQLTIGPTDSRYADLRASFSASVEECSATVRWLVEYYTALGQGGHFGQRLKRELTLRKDSGDLQRTRDQVSVHCRNLSLCLHTVNLVVTCNAQRSVENRINEAHASIGDRLDEINDKTSRLERILRQVEDYQTTVHQRESTSQRRRVIPGGHVPRLLPQHRDDSEFNDIINAARPTGRSQRTASYEFVPRSMQEAQASGTNSELNDQSEWPLRGGGHQPTGFAVGIGSYRQDPHTSRHDGSDDENEEMNDYDYDEDDNENDSGPSTALVVYRPPTTAKLEKITTDLILVAREVARYAHSVADTMTSAGTVRGADEWENRAPSLPTDEARIHAWQEHTMASPSHTASSQSRNPAEPFLFQSDNRTGNAPGFQRDSMYDDDSDESDDEMEMVERLVRLGEAKVKEKQYESAKSSFERAIEINNGFEGPTQAPLIVRKAQFQLALVLMQLRDYGTAKPLLEQIVGTLDDREDPSVVLDASHNLAIIYKVQNKLDKAENHCKKARKGRRRLLGKTHPSYYQSTALLAEVFIAQGLRQDAEALLLDVPDSFVSELSLHGLPSAQPSSGPRRKTSDPPVADTPRIGLPRSTDQTVHVASRPPQDLPQSPVVEKPKIRPPTPAIHTAPRTPTPPRSQPPPVPLDRVNSALPRKTREPVRMSPSSSVRGPSYAFGLGGIDRLKEDPSPIDEGPFHMDSNTSSIRTSSVGDASSTTDAPLTPISPKPSFSQRLPSFEESRSTRKPSFTERFNLGFRRQSRQSAPLGAELTSTVSPSSTSPPIGSPLRELRSLTSTISTSPDNGACAHGTRPCQRQSTLKITVRNGCVAEARRWVEEDRSTLKQKDLDEALVQAAASSLPAMIQFLALHHGNIDAKISAPDEGGNTPLHQATFYNNLACVRMLLRLGCQVDSLDDLGWTPLHWAISRGYIGVAQELLKNGADRNVRNKQKNTPLEVARLQSVRQAIMQLYQASETPRRNTMLSAHGSES